jgi:hypothetical protein
MNPDKNTARLLGIAFLIQAVASAVGGFFLLQPLIVPGDMVESMTRIANHATQMRAGILVEMITAMGVVMLGCMLFVSLKKQNRNLALVALGLYVMEAAILAASRIPAFALLRTSQASLLAGHPDSMQVLANLFYEAQSFGYDLHMLPFALGATLFYALFWRSGLLPRLLALLGIVAAPLALVGMLFSLLGYEVPIVVFIPNLPFELFTGVWLLIAGFRAQPAEREAA